MKKILAIASLFSAVLFNHLAAQENDKDKGKTKIEGSGNVITKEITVQPFDELSLSGVFSVLLSQGSKEQVKIEADDNLQELFEVKNEGSKLIISMKKDVNFQTKDG